MMVLALGCGGGTEQAETTAKAEEPAQAESSTESSQDMAAATSAKVKAPEGIELASATLEGKLGCGHCTFEAKDECSLAMKTADGEVYMIEAGERQDELMDKRYDEPEVKIAGRVGEVEGQKVIYTDSVELE
jgi:hypothetical protein